MHLSTNPETSIFLTVQKKNIFSPINQPSHQQTNQSSTDLNGELVSIVFNCRINLAIRTSEKLPNE
jgi:hypothetical protein